MIQASVVYDALIDLIRADKRGLSLGIDEYNRLARVVNERVYDKFYKDFEESQSNTDAMAGFKQLNHTIALVSGVGVLPDDYYDMIGKPHHVDGSTTRYIDIVTTRERAERAEDFLTQPTTTHAIAEIGDLDGSGDLQIHVYPTTIANIDIDYLRTADVPFLDYYINDTTLEEIYIDAGATAITIPSGYTYRDGTEGVAVIPNGSTVEWEWGDSEMNLILSIFAQFVGIQLPDQLLIETGTINEEK